LWHIERIINFGKSGQFLDGFARFELHDSKGIQFVLAHNDNWIGALSGDDKFIWTAGQKPPLKGYLHFDVEILKPSFISECSDGSYAVTGKNGIFRLHISSGDYDTILLTSEEGIDFIGNAVVDYYDNIWVNDVCGYRILKYSHDGSLIETLGNGKPGFTCEAVPFEKASFNWMYDLRLGQDGNLYILDSKNYAVRMLNIKNRVVTLIAGTGEPGYSGDGGNPIHATFGGNTKEQFDGPWALALDEENNIYIGDTQNHVVRMVDRKKNIITTIAGNPEAVPFQPNNLNEKYPFRLNLPRICGLDYFKGKLFIPEWGGDLIVLNKM
jgi:hypothetical protein